MSHKPRALTGALALLFALTAVSVPAAVSATTGPYLLKNINTSGSSSPEQLTAMGNFVYFTANDGIHGRELWRSDGTALGTQLVKDINPQPHNYEGPWSLTAIDGLLYFNQNDGSHGSELWVSDGTTAGTQLIDIAAGSYPSDPYGFTEYNGLVYFSAGTQATGTELWVTGGTAATTHLAQDIVPGTGRSNPGELTVANGKLYFLRIFYKNGYDHAVLYRTDGSATGAAPVKDRHGNKVRGFKRSYNHALWSVGGILYFTVTSKDLWVSRGTRPSTRKIADFGTRRIVDVDGQAFIDVFDSTVFPFGSTLRRSDGTATGTVAVHFEDGSDIHGASHADSWLMSIGSKALFWAEDGLSVSDGTDFGTHVLGVNVWPGDLINHDEAMIVIDSVMYFDGHTFNSEWNPSNAALWRTDGTAPGTYAVSPTYASNIVDDLTNLNGHILFVNGGSKGAELWRYDP